MFDISLLNKEITELSYKIKHLEESLLSTKDKFISNMLNEQLNIMKDYFENLSDIICYKKFSHDNFKDYDFDLFINQNQKIWLLDKNMENLYKPYMNERCYKLNIKNYIISKGSSITNDFGSLYSNINTESIKILKENFNTNRLFSDNLIGLFIKRKIYLPDILWEIKITKKPHIREGFLFVLYSIIFNI